MNFAILSQKEEETAIPVFAKILIIFGVILVLSRFRFPLSLCLFLGSILLGIWVRLGISPWVHYALISVTRIRTISLGLIVAFILVMSKLMEEAGHMRRLMERFSLLSNDARTVGSFMAALIGLLPMPGGALFSAPMVEASIGEHSVTSEQKTAVNYWFRHVWEYWWPLYPGVVLAVALLKVDTLRYITFMAPMSAISILAGIFFILRPIGKVTRSKRSTFRWNNLGAFLWEIMPILIVILVIMGVAALAGILGFLGVRLRISGGFSILPGLLASTIWICKVNHIRLKILLSAIFNQRVLSMLLLLFSIMIFQGVLVHSNAVIQIRNDLLHYQIPLVLIVLSLPFVSGLITGIALGFVGTSFPLLVPIFPTEHFIEYLSFAGLAYTFGYMGMMLSPIHLCLLVSKDYYHANLLKSYRYIILPVLTVMSSAILLFFLVRAF